MFVVRRETQSSNVQAVHGVRTQTSRHLRSAQTSSPSPRTQAWQSAFSFKITCGKSSRSTFNLTCPKQQYSRKVNSIASKVFSPVPGTRSKSRSEHQIVSLTAKTFDCTATASARRSRFCHSRLQYLTPLECDVISRPQPLITGRDRHI